MADTINIELFEKGLGVLLELMIVEYEERIQIVLKTQIELNKQIDDLASQLTQFQHQSRNPILIAYVKKMNKSKEKLKEINNTITQINYRLDRLYAFAQTALGNAKNSTAAPQISFASFIDSLKTSAKTLEKGMSLESLNTSRLSSLSTTLKEKANVFKFDGITVPTGLTRPPPPVEKPATELKTLKIEHGNEFVSAVVDVTDNEYVSAKVNP